MSDLQQPVYGGARMNAASSTPSPVQIADVSTKPTQRALQNAQEFVSDVASQYQRMKDFGEETRLNGQMDSLATEFEQEMTRRLGFARGHDLSFYNGDGTLKESSLNTFVRNYEGKFRGLKGSFVSQESAAKFGARQQEVMNRLQGRASELLLKGQIQESRQAFEEGLEGDLARQNYAGASYRAQEAAEAGVISQQKADNLGYGFHQEELMKEAHRLMWEDPSELAFQIDEGRWNELNENNLLKVQTGLERMLRDKAEQLPYTDSELKAIQEGRMVQPKYADLPGDTEKMRVWRQAKREGKLYLYKDDIEAEFRKEIANGPVFDSQAKYETWKKEMVKDWSDEKTGFGLTPDEVELACDHHIANMMSAGSGNSFNAAKLFDDLGYQQVVPLFYEKWRKKAETGYLTSNRRAMAEGAAVNEMEAAMERVKNKAFRAFIAWEQKNTKASREEKFMKATDLITNMSEEEKVSISGDVIQNKADKKAIYERVFGKMDDYFSDSGKAVLDEQKKRHQEYREERAESAKKATQQRSVDQTKFMPVEADNVINVPEREPGIYLDKKMFEQVVKAHGDAPVVLATIPERGSRRAAAKLPILGWHEGEGTMLTSGARIRLLGRIRNVNSLQLKFLKNSESKALEDSKMKEFTEKKKRKARDTDAPPDDFGLVPNNGVETARPVSGTYLNGELTMLPPL